MKSALVRIAHENLLRANAIDAGFWCGHYPTAALAETAILVKAAAVGALRRCLRVLRVRYGCGLTA